jgi:hypothetical protein
MKTYNPTDLTSVYNRQTKRWKKYKWIYLGIVSALNNHILATLNAISYTQSKINRIDIFPVIIGHHFIK